MVLRTFTQPTFRQPKTLIATILPLPPSSETVAPSRELAIPLNIIPFTSFAYVCCFPCYMSHSGGAVAGSVSQLIGRRLTIIIFVLFAGAFIPLWILPDTFGPLSAGAFWLQFGVQGAWGVIPIQLAEMSPPGFRATFPGVTYQLGNVWHPHAYMCVDCWLNRHGVDDFVRLCSD